MLQTPPMNSPPSLAQTMENPADIPAGMKMLPLLAGFMEANGPLWGRLHEDDGLPVMGFRVELRHCNPMQVCHGGMLMTFADMAWGHIVSIERSSYWVTVRLVCDFLSSAKLGDWVEGGGETLSIEDDLFIVQGRIWVGDRTLMTGTGVFKPLGPRDPKPGEKAYRPPAA
jgi:acyl-coenzyme A thioesterase PaaI-like protein